MKKAAMLTLISTVLILFVNAQVLIPYGNVPIPDEFKNQKKRIPNKHTKGLITDTLNFTAVRASTLQYMKFTTNQKVAQYFSCPQSMDVSGFYFYANHCLSGPVDVEASIYLAGSDSLPTGTAIARDTVTVVGDGKIQATFSTPASVSSPYVCVLTSLGDTASFYSNVPPNGAGDNLSFVKVSSSYHKMLDLGFDVDWLIRPVVTYDLTVAIEKDRHCINDGNTVNFRVKANPAAYDRMYSQTAFYGLLKDTYWWDFGDGSALVNDTNVNHTYTTAGKYYITLIDTFYIWTFIETIQNTIDSIDVCSDIQDKEAEAGIRIFPNPVYNEFYVSNVNRAEISVFNILGQEIYRQRTYTDICRIDMIEHPEGIYVIRIEDKNGSISKRINIVR